MKRNEIIALTCGVALVMGLLGFGAGRASAPKLATTATGNGMMGQGGFGGGTGGTTGGGFRRGGRPTFGTVASLSGSTLVITDTAGTAHTVTLTASTTYTSGDGTAATQASLTAGTNVAAFGAAGTDGTVTATRVIVNPTTPGSGAAPPAGSQAN